MRAGEHGARALHRGGTVDSSRCDSWPARAIRLAGLFVILAAGQTVAGNVPRPGADAPWWARVPAACDDFEDPGWVWVFNNPKATQNVNYDAHLPPGYPTNLTLMRKYPFDEDTWVGQPDTLQIVPTPAGGPSGSTQALAFATTFSSTNTGMFARDGVGWLTDRQPIGYHLTENPAYTVCVYVPPLSTCSCTAPSTVCSCWCGKASRYGATAPACGMTS
jgi:hypothetical protein